MLLFLWVTFMWVLLGKCWQKNHIGKKLQVQGRRISIQTGHRYLTLTTSLVSRTAIPSSANVPYFCEGSGEPTTVTNYGVKPAKRKKKKEKKNPRETFFGVKLDTEVGILSLEN